MVVRISNKSSVDDMAHIDGEPLLLHLAYYKRKMLKLDRQKIIKGIGEKK